MPPLVKYGDCRPSKSLPARPCLFESRPDEAVAFKRISWAFANIVLCMLPFLVGISTVFLLGSLQGIHDDESPLQLTCLLGYCLVYSGSASLFIGKPTSTFTVNREYVKRKRQQVGSNNYRFGR
ncbi:hypothetical protein B0H10DRAFT_2103279 [Mycena sp. CBHHK59/15]|nr:hypothetical protein B0H10DRAFT_2103279 [Mycena sp. CBHHK59/15]